MLNGHENSTFELNDQEQELVPIFVRRFKNQPGKNNSVTNKEMISGLAKIGIKITEPRIRKVIQYIRLNRLLPGLVATSNGYFLTTNIKEFEDWIESMKQRENIIRQSREIGEQDLEQMKQYYFQQEKEKKESNE